MYPSSIVVFIFETQITVKVSKNENNDAAWIHVCKELTKSYENQSVIFIADNRFFSTALLEWGVQKKIGFVCTVAGNPICIPELMRSKTSETWKYLKASARGRLCTVHSELLNFTMCRDSSVLRIADNCLEGQTISPRVVRRYNKATKIWRGLGKVFVDLLTLCVDI